MSRPLMSIGVDEPMFVCGAIASTSADMPITAPAESALEPGRRDVHDHRHLRGEHRLHDLPHRGRQPARRVHDDHDRRRLLLLAAMDRVDEVVLRDRVDVVLELDREHVGLPRLGGRSRHREEERSGNRRERDDETPQEGRVHVPTAYSRGCKHSVKQGLRPLPANVQPRTLFETLVPRRLLIVVLLALGAPATAWADGATITSRDVPLRGDRALQAAAPARFSLVGLHWQGTGSVAFRTRSLGGRWSAWQPAQPEDDGPDRASRERRLTGWRLGSPWWVGPSDGIRYRIRGDVRRLRAWFVWSPVVRVPERQLSIAGSPQFVPRSAWRADERIVRAKPVYADRLSFSVVHHTAGRNGYSFGRVGRDRPLDPAVPREGERLERHRLQPARRPFRQGLRGSRRGCRPQRRRGARRRLQHRLGRRRRDRRVQRHHRAEGGGGRARRRPRVAARPRARRPPRHALAPLRRQPALPRRPAGVPARGLRSSRHRLHLLSRERALRAARLRSPARPSAPDCRSSTSRVSPALSAAPSASAPGSRRRCRGG